ncbi:MAG: hypothetical protein K0U80_14005 [Actinomycetia bacterium]|nr:hypothetical protein [Actinomycetes bacterium]MCH9759182.1 hypothetical protein [Actinomycetes bacterium]
MTYPNGVNPRQVETLIDARIFNVQAQRHAVVVADAVIPVVTAFARAYTRGRGFDTETGEPNNEVAAVITAASARFASNTAQTSTSRTEQEITVERRSWFTGWTLAELSVLNRYRKRAM